jgi:predicted transcriptional regulator
MSQQDVLKILKRQPHKEFTIEELAAKLGVKKSIANVWVLKLDKWGNQVDCRTVCRERFVRLAKK